MQTKMDKQIQPGDYAITWLIRAGKNSPHRSPVPRRLRLCGEGCGRHLRKRPKGFKSASFCSFRSLPTMADVAVIEGRGLWQAAPPWLDYQESRCCWRRRNRWWTKQLTRSNGACFYEPGTRLGQDIGVHHQLKGWTLRHASEGSRVSRSFLFSRESRFLKKNNNL